MVSCSHLGLVSASEVICPTLPGTGRVSRTLPNLVPPVVARHPDISNLARQKVKSTSATHKAILRQSLELGSAERTTPKGEFRGKLNLSVPSDDWHLGVATLCLKSQVVWVGTPWYRETRLPESTAVKCWRTVGEVDRATGFHLSGLNSPQVN